MILMGDKLSRRMAWFVLFCSYNELTCSVHVMNVFQYNHGKVGFLEYCLEFKIVIQIEQCQTKFRRFIQWRGNR